MQAVVVLASMLVIVSVVWFVGVVFEFEYPHILEIRRVRGGVTVDGQRAVAAVARVLGTTEERIHVHICSYCRARLAGVPDTTYVQVSAPDVDTQAIYGFAYRRTTNELAPADAAAIAKFDALLPSDVVLSPATDAGSDPLLRVPAVWRSSR